MFCAEFVAQLRDNPDLNLVIVTMATAEEARVYRQDHRLPQMVLCDPDEDMYREFGLQNARMSQVLNFRTIGRGVRATWSRHRSARPGRNPMRLGGAFVIATDGRVTWSHFDADISDHATPAMIGEALSRAAKEA